jgi:16S rRNA (adenine1518-N6/adenine1519-N6)-dimethyltransferase
MIVAKKRFGQNFLKDSEVVDKIIQSMPKDDNVITEIGPGLGDLTQKLVKHRKVVAFEIDKSLCERLNKQFKDEIKRGDLELNCGDVIDFWQDRLIENRYNLVANLPYNVATHIILKALEDSNCKNILVMVQKEVAQKFCASNLAKEFSALAVLTEVRAKGKILFDVPKEAFEPQPKVTSSVMLITKDDSKIPKVVNESFDDFKKFLKAAFVAPRKLLIKNLSSIIQRDRVQKLFEELKIEPNIRPHQLSTPMYCLIFEKVGRVYGEKQHKSKQQDKEQEKKR